MKRVILITVVLGWAGGMGTALLAGSCDVECEPDGDLSSVVATLRAAPGTTWNPVVNPASVTFEIHSPDDPVMSWGDDRTPTQDLREPVTRWTADCLDDACTTWSIGTDRPGRYQITADVCGETYTAWRDVERDEGQCHVETVFAALEIDGSACQLPMKAPVADDCQLPAHPSVYVTVATPKPDVPMGVPVDRVWFEHEGEVREAWCVGEDPDACDSWIAGQDLTGPVTVYTRYCDREFSTTVEVGKTADGCHANTEYEVLVVDTLGCLTDSAQPPPPPTGPTEALG